MPNRKVLILSKHVPFCQWLASQGILGELVPYLDMDELIAGDILIGAPPVWLAERLVNRGVEVYIICFDKKVYTETGKLNVQQMEEAGAHLRQVTSLRLSTPLSSKQMQSL